MPKADHSHIEDRPIRVRIIMDLDAPYKTQTQPKNPLPTRPQTTPTGPKHMPIPVPPVVAQQQAPSIQPNPKKRKAQAPVGTPLLERLAPLPLSARITQVPAGSQQMRAIPKPTPRSISAVHNHTSAYIVNAPRPAQ